jgi:hypothetical protein
MAKAKKKTKMSYDEATRLVKDYLIYFGNKHADHSDIDCAGGYAFKLGCAEAMLAALLSEQMTPTMYAEVLRKRMAEGT